jgi:hypothetical protein
MKHTNTSKRTDPYVGRTKNGFRRTNSLHEIQPICEKWPRTEKVENQCGSGALAVSLEGLRSLKGLKVETEDGDKHTLSLQQLPEFTS